MPASLTVLCAVRGPAEADVVVALGAPGSGAIVTRRCGELAELLAAAAAGAGAVAVVSADLPGLDRDAVGRLHAAGVRVVALGDGMAPVERLRALGVDVVVERYEDAEVVAAVRAAASSARPVATGVGDRTGGPSDAPESTTGDAAGLVLGRHVERSVDDAGGPDVEGAADDERRRGRVVAVWGPVGAPGRTATAVELAADLAGLAAGEGHRRRRRGVRPEPSSVLLVDADTYGSSVASRLGMLDDVPGLAAVARAAGQGLLDAAGLARHAPLVAGRLRVLTGISRASRWPELPATSLEVVFERAREVADWTVVDCGAVLEADETLSYDTYAPQRNAATLCALQAADVVVVVGAADPIGIQRLVRGLEELEEVPLPVVAPRVVVMNRMRPSAVGPRPEAAVRDALSRYAGLDDVHVVPDDRAAVDAAVLAGRTLAEHAPTSPAAAGFAALGGAVRELVLQPV